jgi:hypothetical protein
MSELTVVQATKGLRQRLKESVLGIKTFDLVYKPKAEHSLVFHVCQPTAGGEGIIHCSVKNIPHESLLQALPMLAPQVNKNSGAYLVVTGTDQISIESPWAGERIDYVRMTKLYKA